MCDLRVQVVRFVDVEPQPGIVESQFRDAQGEVHSIIDKTRLFTSADLWSDSDYPQPGFIKCRVLERMTGPDGNLARINIEPYCFELANEKSEFVIIEAELCDEQQFWWSGCARITGYLEVATSAMGTARRGLGFRFDRVDR